VPLGAEQRRELVEQAGLRAHPVVLDPRAEPGELTPVGLGVAAVREQRERQRHLERRRRRQPAAARDVAAEPQRSTAQREPRTRQLCRHAADERSPPLGALDPVEHERVGLSEVERGDLDGVRGPVVGDRHRHAGGNRERQAEAVVVVGVLADEVHAAGPERPHLCHGVNLIVITSPSRMT
jgi:hypothetical protein